MGAQDLPFSVEDRTLSGLRPGRARRRRPVVGCRRLMPFTPDPVCPRASPWRGLTRSALRSLRLAPGLVLAWTLATLLAVRLSGVAQLGGISLGETATRSLLVGALVGLAASWLEGGLLPWWWRRLPLWAVLALQTAVYALVVFAAAATVAGLVWAWNDAPTSAEVDETEALLRTWAFRGFLALLVLSSLLINLGTALRRALGQGTLTALLIGRYRRPVVEDRAFLFLDLRDSTSIAEALGPLRFTAFKADFFADVSGPALDTDGRIVQYVGDSVMVTWPMARGLAEGAPLRFFFLVERAVEARAARYRARYGSVPAFGAGVHGGEVVTAQVGEVRREIVYSGDVVNTAARIEGECRPRGRRLLVSASLLGRMALPPGLVAEDLGRLPLRGRADAEHVWSVERLEAAPSEAA